MVDFTDNFSQYAVSKLPDFKEDFAFHGTQAEADASWVPEDVTRSRVNTVTDVLDLDIFRDDTNDAIVHDLGSTVSDSNWVLRFKLQIDTLNLTALQTQGFFGLFDGDGTEGEETIQNSIGVVLTALTGTLTYRLFTSQDTTIASGASTTFAHALAVETVYVEIKRNSKTSYEVNLYSDAKFTDLIESQQGTCSRDTIDLRYIGMKNNMSLNAGSRIRGSMDDVEFWKAGNKPTFQDNFSTYNSQIQADNAWVPNDSANIRVNPATNVLDWDIIMDGSNDAIALDLGAGNVDDNKFILRFTLNITTQTQDTTGMAFNIGISDSDQTVGSTASQDWIGFNYLNNNSFNGRWICAQSDDAQINGAGGNGTPVNELLPTATDIFFEIKRLSATTMEVNRYSDSTYTTILDTSVHSGFSGTTGLRYIKITNIDLSLAEGVGIGTIDNIEFYNGVTEVPTSIEVVEGAVSLEEKFILRAGDFEDDFSGTDDWDDAHASSGVNTTTDVIDFTFDTINQNESIVYDLENVLGVGNVADPSQWALRFKFNLSSTTPSLANIFYVGLNSTDELVDSTVAQHGVNIAIMDATLGVQGYRTYDFDNQIPNITGHDSQEISNPFLLGTDYYVELKRTSVTTYECQVFTDADFIIPFGVRITGTLTTTAGLRYIKILNVDTATVGNLTGTIDDVKFYNGESLLSRWNERTSDGILNTNDERIDWTMIRNGTDNRVVRDLGTAVSDENWTLRFRYHVNAGGVITTNSGANYQVLIQDTDVGQTASNDTIGFSMSNSVSPTGRTLVLLARAGGSSNGFATTPDEIIPFGGAFDLYVELKRLTPTSVICNVYNDSDYTDLFTTLSITTTSATNGLRYLICSSGDQVTGWDGIETGFIDCIELYDCASVAKTPVKSKVADFEDGFWEDNWTDVGAQHGVNTSTNVIDWNSARLAEAINQTTFDMETILPNGINPVKWGLRFKYKINAVTAGGASSQFAVFLTSLASNNSSESAQDHATWKIQGNVPPILAGMIDDGTQIFTGGASSFGEGAPVGEFGYAEMTRNGTLFSWAVYSDPDYTQLLGSGSVNDNSVLAGLRYLKVGRRDGTATAFTFNGTIEEIKFWNGSLPTEHANKWVEVNVP